MDSIKSKASSNLGIPESARVKLNIDEGGIHETFVTSFVDTAAILGHFSIPDWIDKQPKILLI